jgi:hypothetical protein
MLSVAKMTNMLSDVKLNGVMLSVLAPTGWECLPVSNGHHDIQHKDTQHNGTQQKVLICDIQHNDTQHNNIPSLC